MLPILDWSRSGGKRRDQHSSQSASAFPHPRMEARPHNEAVLDRAPISENGQPRVLRARLGRCLAQQQDKAVRFSSHRITQTRLIASILGPLQQIAPCNDLEAAMGRKIPDGVILGNAMQIGRRRAARAGLCRMVDQKQDSAWLERSRQLLEYRPGINRRPALAHQ